MQFMNPRAFKENSQHALDDDGLKAALNSLKSGFIPRREDAVNGLPEYESVRLRGKEIKDHVLNNLDYYLEIFEKKVAQTGGKVHWCPTPDDARNTILQICQKVDAKKVTKGKSMIAEEVQLNPFLERNGIEAVETDLGEYIIQLAGEPPSHIIGPALHKTKEQVAELFYQKHKKYGKTELHEEPTKLISEAREVLRQKFMDADVGITGANFLIAETGSTVIVTNEGNGDLTQLLPNVHIVITSIEKIVPNLDDLAILLRLLSRSATGQDFAAYTTFSTGPKRQDDLDGPNEFHVILLDNGRSAMLGGELKDMLRCIRCGACMNHCPVYQSVGGHTYGSVYVGPMGSVLSPSLQGVEDTHHLPNASTFCGRCESVCPMQIPLPKLMRYWREKAFYKNVQPSLERWWLAVWSFFVKKPWVYGLVTRFGVMALKVLVARGKISWLLFTKGWTKGRDFPIPEGGTFQSAWRRTRRGVKYDR